MADEESEPTIYAERMFPAPVDHGIATDGPGDVARSHSGVDTAELGSWQNERWYQGGGRVGEKAVERITIYPPTGGVQTQGDPFEPVRIGILVDMDIGQLLADWIDPTILAIEDALNEGVYDRPVELFTVDARGLPRENYRKVRKGYRRLVDEGCVVVLGPMISDNSVTTCATRQRDRRGLHRLDGRGARSSATTASPSPTATSPTESTMCANWCFQEGYTKVGFFWEKGSSGTDYSDYFRRTAGQLGLEIIKEVVARPQPAGPEGAPRRRCATRAPRPIVVRRATATRRSTSPEAFQGARLGPAAHHGHRVHVLFELQRVGRGARGLARRRPARRGRRRTRTTRRCCERFEARFGRISRNVVVALAYDTARAGDPRHRQRAHRRRREQVKDGLEMIKWMPCTNGGPGTLHHVRPVRPPRLQGRLPHHPRAPRRRAPLPRLLPPAVALEPVVAAPRLEPDRRPTAPSRRRTGVAATDRPLTTWCGDHRVRGRRRDRRAGAASPTPGTSGCMADEVVGHAVQPRLPPAAHRAAGRLLGRGPRRARRRTPSGTATRPSVVRMHSGNGPHEEMDRRAIACFDVGARRRRPDRRRPLRQVLHDYFAWATTTTMARYHDSADDVPDGLPLPHWSWDGLVD